MNYSVFKWLYTLYNIFIMEWWNFTDLTFVTFFSIVVACLLCIAFVVITFAVTSNSLIKDQKKIRSDALTTRVYKIDVKRNVVTYFNKTNLRVKRKIDMNGFYQRFNSEDVAKVKAWIFNICLDVKSVDPYLEVDVLVDRGHTSYFSLLKLIKYDALAGIIHAESFILKYITAEDTEAKNKQGKGIPTGVVKRSTMEEIFTKDKSTKGYTFAIRFFYKRQAALTNDKIERYMMMTLKNVIYPFASDYKVPRQIVDDGNNEMLLFDLRIDSQEEGLRLANSMAHELNKCIGVNGFSNSVNFSIGVVENALHYQDFESIYIKAQETSMSGQHTGEEVVLYQKQAQQNVEITKYRNEVEKMLKHGALRYLFRPIVDSHKHKVIGYFEYVKAYDTPFTTYGEMSKYASRFEKNKELFAIIAKFVIPKFSSECENKSWRLFLKISFLDLDYVVPVLNSIPESKSTRIVLVLDEQEINENSGNLEVLNGALNAIKNAKFELAMLMKDKNLLLDPSVYENFDYFVAGSMMISEIKVNSRSRLSIHTLIEQLLRYKRPIIATDLESWQSIELIIKSGVSIISTEVISPSNDMLLPIDKKKMDKLVDMDEAYN